MVLLTASVAVAVTGLGRYQARAAEPAPGAEVRAGGLEIPLADIWALDMPGTRPIDRSLGADGKWRAPEGALAGRICGALSGHAEKRGLVYVRLAPKIETAFAVSGMGLDGLRNASAVLVDGKPAAGSVAAGGPASVFFFSKTSGSYAHIRRVTVGPEAVTIRYAFVPHQTKEVTAHFALLPLPALAPGRYRVEVQGELDEKWRQTLPNVKVDEWAQQSVCRPGAFTVLAPGAPVAAGPTEPVAGKVLKVQWEGRKVLAVFADSGAQEVWVLEEDGSLRGWNPASGKLLREIKGLGYLTAAVFSADGRQALVASPRSRPHLLDVASGKDVQDMAIAEDLVQTVSLSRDGALACLSARGQVYVWSLKHKQGLRKFPLKRDWSSIAFSPDGKLGLSYLNTFDRCAVALWDLGQAQTLGSFPTPLTALAPGSVTISPDSTKVLLGTGGALWLYDLAAEKEQVLTVGPAGRGAAFSPDGRWVAAVVDGKAQLCRLEDAKWFEVAGGIEGWPNQLAFSPDQKHIAVACGPTAPPPASPGAKGPPGDPFTRLYVIPVSGLGELPGVGEPGAVAMPQSNPVPEAAAGDLTREQIVEAAMKIGAVRWGEQVKGWDAKRGGPRCLNVPPRVERDGANWRVTFEHQMNAPAGGTSIVLMLDAQGNETTPAKCLWVAK